MTAAPRLALLLVALTAALAAAQPKAAAERVKNSVARIEGRYGHGSGFLVAPNVVATNAHVVINDLPADVTVRFSTDGLPDRAGLKARLLYADKGRDLVFLLLDGDAGGRAPLPLARAAEPVGGAKVFVVGNPGQDGGLALANTIGVAKWDPDVAVIGGEPFYRLAFPAAAAGDIRIGRGNSGGPAVNDRGEVLGVLTRGDIGKDNRPTGRAYLIPAKAVQSALDGLGARSGWDDAAKKTTARHALDIAAVNLHAHAMIGGTVLDARVALKQGGLSGTRLMEADKAVVRLYQSVAKRLEEVAAPARKTALADAKALTPAQRDALDAAASALRRLKEKVVKPVVTPGEYKQAQAAENEVYQAVGRVRAESGVRDDVLRSMLDGIEDDLNGVVKLDGQDPIRLRPREAGNKN